MRQQENNLNERLSVLLKIMKFRRDEDAENKCRRQWDMEQIYNYQDMSPEQRETALNALSSIGFCPAYGKVKTMQKIMDKSSGEKMPQFYFVFRDTKLIGYMFLIGDRKRFRAFPWLAVDNLDELPLRMTEQLIAIAIRAWSNESGSLAKEDGSDTETGWVAQNYRQRLENYRRGTGRRNENECR